MACYRDSFTFTFLLYFVWLLQSMILWWTGYVAQMKETWNKYRDFGMKSDQMLLHLENWKVHVVDDTGSVMRNRYFCINESASWVYIMRNTVCQLSALSINSRIQEILLTAKEVLHSLMKYEQVLCLASYCYISLNSVTCLNNCIIRNKLMYGPTHKIWTKIEVGCCN
jgi:hypothetical protein